MGARFPEGIRGVGDGMRYLGFKNGFETCLVVGRQGNGICLVVSSSIKRK
jgi:hypothetical protein